MEYIYVSQVSQLVGYVLNIAERITYRLVKQGFHYATLCETFKKFSRTQR